MLSFYKQFFWDRHTSAYINSLGFLVCRTWLTGDPDWKPWDSSYSHSLLTSADIAALASSSVPQTHPILLFLVATLLTNPHSHFCQFILLDNEESNCRLSRLAMLCNQHKELKETILHITYTNTNESLIKFILYSAEKLFFPLRTATSSKKQCVEKRNSRSPTWVWTRGKLRRWHVPQDLYLVWPRADVWKNVTFKNIYIPIKALFRCTTV